MSSTSQSHEIHNNMESQEHDLLIDNRLNTNLSTEKTYDNGN